MSSNVIMQNPIPPTSRSSFSYTWSTSPVKGVQGHTISTPQWRRGKDMEKERKGPSSTERADHSNHCLLWLLRNKRSGVRFPTCSFSLMPVPPDHRQALWFTLLLRGIYESLQSVESLLKLWICVLNSQNSFIIWIKIKPLHSCTWTAKRKMHAATLHIMKEDR